MKYYKFKGLLQENQWLVPAFVGVDEKGCVQYLSNQPPAEVVAYEAVSGYAIPGFQNAHSHAFQFAMAGMAEQHAPGTRDDFWSWREAMYKCALSLDPDQIEAVAAMLYAEMLRRGYTSVAEFHYLHHDTDGKPYANWAETGERLVAAAKTAGIKITLVPVFYQKGNFGEDPQPRQRRFISRTLDDYLHLLDDSSAAVLNYDDARLGFGVHSLRAVEARDVIATFSDGPTNIPFHLHAAEQLKEVADCEAYLKTRPVQWLTDNLPVNNRFHIVHCTHMTDAEMSALANSGAHAVLCPGTEGNLGDGIFRLTDYAKAGGNFSIGTDSHISLNPLEDLRWLDYAQRFTTHQRNTFDDGAQTLFTKTLTGGRRAMSTDAASQFFALQMPFDAVVFDAANPFLARLPQHLLPSLLYTADSGALLGTLVNGKWVVKNQAHAAADVIRPGFKAAMKKLLR
ncbi:formimidoylglutamate deiminase [Chryseolinea lacunae]|uniref:Formimidoylglutamate deiminase n=1 Tax=Chryseolinea lacunae TaxID=2801331 RepID=A0ABS1KQL5_9BACT|nr:formimidoylglutamate deiminase [Chryseolinea lacunae]MBL0741744.1 formimidoylglutamate deiminase [Chryseolinea lacunae]